MTQHNPQTAQSVSLDDIRAIYPHLPPQAPDDSAMERAAFLVFVHDQVNSKEATGQTFLAHNNNFDTRATQPLAVAAEMCRADYKIFDLSPPETQVLPALHDDVALAISYGMVTVEQGIDYIALHVEGDEAQAKLGRIDTVDDITAEGALHIAACYGVAIAARMAGISVCLSRPLSDCLTRIADSEGWGAQFVTLDTETLTQMALALIHKRALSLIV